MTGVNTLLNKTSGDQMGYTLKNTSHRNRNVHTAHNSSSEESGLPSFLNTILV